MKKWPALILLAILALALALRLWGLTWGLPLRTDLHPDETDYVMRYALSLHWNNLDPGFLNYPALLMYLIAGVSSLLQHLGVISEVWQCYVVGRSINALVGSATALVAFLVARELGARTAGAVLAALWAAILPLHVWESHVAVTDILMTFWTVTLAYASLRVLRRGGWRSYAFAGLALGLAAGSKYTAAIAAVMPVAAALLSRRPMFGEFKGLLVAAAAAAAACFAVTPYSFIRFTDLLAAMSYEHHHTVGHHYGFSVPADGWQYHRFLWQIMAGWPFSLGFGLYASAVAGLAWAACRIDRPKAVLLSFFAVFFAITGSWTLVPLRYYLPLLLVMVIFAGCWQGAWLASGQPVRRAVAGLFMAAAMAYTAVYTVQTTARYAHETRVEAGRWLADNMPDDFALYVCGWERYMALPGKAGGGHWYRRNEDFHKQAQLRPGRDLLQITSLLYERHYRHNNPAWVASYEELRSPDGDYRLAARFTSSFINKTLYMKLDPMFEGYFISPTLEFYTPKPGTAHAQRARDTRT